MAVQQNGSFAAAVGYQFRRLQMGDMAPQHIDDLPRHEEPRQLMLGLIDELPQERRDARQLMMWGWLGLAVVLFVVLVWVTAPNGPPGPSPSNSLLASQGSGESQAGKNNNVMPRQNSTVGSGQNASGEAAPD
jgi:hypothetical protein